MPYQLSVDKENPFLRPFLLVTSLKKTCYLNQLALSCVTTFAQKTQHFLASNCWTQAKLINLNYIVEFRLTRHNAMAWWFLRTGPAMQARNHEATRMKTRSVGEWRGSARMQYTMELNVIRLISPVVTSSNSIFITIASYKAPSPRTLLSLLLAFASPLSATNNRNARSTSSTRAALVAPAPAPAGATAATATTATAPATETIGTREVWAQDLRVVVCGGGGGAFACVGGCF